MTQTLTRSILIVEDDQLVRESLRDVLSVEGYTVETAADGKEGIRKLEDESFDLALVDMRLPQVSGIDVLKTVKEKYPKLDIIMMTSFGTIETAIEAMRLGATDYLTKPINDDEIRTLLDRIFGPKTLEHEDGHVRKEFVEKKDGFHNLIGEAPKMQKIYSIIRAICDTDTTVFLKGESGTGKGMVAQAIHYSDPARRNGPFIEVSCGAIPRELLESELFGHVKGAFTSAVRDRIGRFELADGGTILLDEIDSLPPYLQVKLLRALQQKVFEKVGDTKTISVDVRIIAATNRDLTEEIKNGNFREDLYYRLNVITLEVPPLRERKSDIPALIQHFIRLYNEKAKRNIAGVSREAMNLLMSYDWPGNVRELENFLERAVVLSTSNVLDQSSFPDGFAETPGNVQASQSAAQMSLKEALREPEKRIIVRALEYSGWNRQKAAAVLQINRTTLYNKMKEHKLL
ncbi:MAG: hypothetical protein A3G33_07970 [Omnitrophica bacterium RIFCSPLOWO2_12_FULL_44_17]|uniref:Sigma-54-dependent Fis family transcriptional regulator n=1 Tax=Candidatus Danuiimicrobium aquiferis TaxID=1801832 RepID=A0A1G1L0Z8_9BACT|nr:MAG: hypothetical protein A3E74_10620 [Omnitrophica bacterium RIFCSPHIGHO2_12_FULL_44_12]OGW98816.1 MAG: hypothetical protein A3G33_07970 [Omnitrophica bacterium RIFCSPLOWO2_12_FULL_44_17]